MSDETWLIGREMDASKKILVATGNEVFDFDLFIGGRRQKQRDGNSFKLPRMSIRSGTFLSNAACYS